MSLDSLECIYRWQASENGTNSCFTTNYWTPDITADITTTKPLNTRQPQTKFTQTKPQTKFTAEQLNPRLQPWTTRQNKNCLLINQHHKDPVLMCKQFVRTQTSGSLSLVAETHCLRGTLAPRRWRTSAGGTLQDLHTSSPRSSQPAALSLDLGAFNTTGDNYLQMLQVPVIPELQQRQDFLSLGFCKTGRTFSLNSEDLCGGRKAFSPRKNI